MEMIDEKIFFQPGDVVTLKLDIPNKPIMIVERKAEAVFKREGAKTLRGIICRWFTTDGTLQTATFSTKDLVKL